MATVTAPAVPGTIRLSAEIRRYLRDLVAKRDGWTCFYCRRPVVAPPLGRSYSAAEAPSVATLDHWLPVARGGSWDLGNLVLACDPCNHEKHTLTGNEYLAVLTYRNGRDRSPARRWSPIGRFARCVRWPGTTVPETGPETPRGHAR